MDEELNCEECGSIFTVDGIDVEREDRPRFCPYCGHEMYEWDWDVEIDE